MEEGSTTVVEKDSVKSHPWKEKLGSVEIQIAIKTGIAAAIGWTLGLASSHILERPDSLVSGLWCAITAIVVLQAYLGGTYKAALSRLLGVIIGSVMGGLFTSLLGSNPVSLGISVFLTTIICSLFLIKDSIRIASLSVTVVMVLWGLRPNISPWTFALFRSIDSFLGILVAVLVAHAIWPFQATEKLRSNAAKSLSLINQLYRLVTAVKLQKQETQELIEQINALFLQDVQYLTEAKMELLTAPEQLELWSSIHDHLEHLFEVILSLKHVFLVPRKIVDSQLAAVTDRVIRATDEAIQELVHGLTLDKMIKTPDALTSAQNELQMDLGRFRSTRTTRQFSLPEVESFYVFYYSLNAVADEVQKLTKKVNAIIEEE